MKTKLLSLAVLAALSAPTFAHQAGDTIVRVGAVYIDPNASSENVMSLLGEFDVNEYTDFGLNFTHMVTDNIGFEVLLAAPFTHDVSLGGNKVAELSLLPPTVSAQYYFGSGNFRPYVGAGINTTFFFEEEFTAAAQSQGFSDLKLDTSFGPALQAGFDFKVNEDLLINAAVWYMDIGTDVEFKHTVSPTTTQRVGLDIDPWVYMVSIGYSF